MKKINFVDALFNNEGHYVVDITNYAYLSDKYELHYFVNGNISKENKKKLKNFIIHESNGDQTTFGQIKYFISIKNLLCKNDFNFIMSCTYIPLFIFSILNRFYYYHLLIHFFPTVKVILYKYILIFLLKKSFGFFVLESFVKNDILKKIGKSAQDKIFVSHSRDIIESSEEHNENDKIKVSFIGAMNPNKNINVLLNLIKENYYENIEFGFYSKGIKSYLFDLKTLNNINFKDEYFSENEYINYLYEADFVFLSYTDDYGIRFSGMVCDVLNNGCQLICNDNPSFRHYIVKYKCGYIFNNREELHNILLNLRKLDVSMNIYDEYSKEKRENIFLAIVENFFKLQNEITKGQK